ncbi:Gfo/Idh/MocA family protein [Vibrio hepatarius]|uniref:Gfo/Idh/MocA family protein n=1 Tax=Vibrio hepatarius TaxID=171383 RepID=UPI00142E3BEB|nr:Gfo/Idh/MocA family oxidoreductase [Vibrio hepatarius]NIY82336.1 Gfo/Idh/MocA family oxidoreductase [Vibrio hepatarius]
MKIGIIGLGDIAQKAYLPIISQLDNVEPIFCTRNAQTLAQLSQKYRVSQSCQDYRQLVELGVDAVMVHAATSVHTQIAGYFLKLGIPTFVDKPLADSAADVEELYELAERHRTPLYVGFNRRHIPLFNQSMPEYQFGQCGDLLSLRWEKHRLDLPGKIRTFVFDDFIHPLDSINLNAKTTLDDVYVTQQFSGQQLARLDVQWQVGNTLLHASMNRQFGITSERVSASYTNQAFEFDSFTQGRCWQNGEESVLRLKDWTPMLASKGFEAMIADWIQVIEQGKLDTSVMVRNIASHQLAERLVEKLHAKLR